MSPEVELLLACAREGGAEGDARIRHLLRVGVEWDDVLRVGGRHGLLPVVHRRLQEIRNGQPPTEVSETLHRRYYGMAYRNVRLTARLVELIEALRARDVPVLPLKGSVLAGTVYENVALREFGDLDLLVRRDDLDTAREVLVDEGLEPSESWAPGQDAGFRWIWYAYGWRDGETGVWVELHWRLAPRFFPAGIDAGDLFAATEEVDLRGHRVTVMRPEETLLALCIHGAKEEPHPWNRLKWVLDVARVIRSRPDLDWARLLDRAETAGCLRMLLVGLRLASDLLGAPLPEAVRARIARDRTAVELASWIRDRLVGDAPPVTRLERLGFELKVRERPTDRGRTLLRRALLPDTSDLRRVRLPPSLAGLYVPVRLLRLVWRGVLRPWRILWLWRPLEKREASPSGRKGARAA